MSNATVESGLKVMAAKLREHSKAPGTEGAKQELRQAAKRLEEIVAKLSGKALEHRDITITVELKDGLAIFVPPGVDQEPNWKKRMACGSQCRSAGTDYKYLGKGLENADPKRGMFSVKATPDSIAAVEQKLSEFYPGATLVDSKGAKRSLPVPPPKE